jgi:hypothetical protein
MSSPTVSLSAVQLGHLFQLLSPDVVSNESLDSICGKLTEKFPKPDAFKIGLALVQLLTQPDLLCGDKHQIFAALVFLHELYKGEPFVHNPFAAVFVKYLQASEEDTEQQAETLGNGLMEPDESVNAVPRLSPVEKQVRGLRSL